MEALLVILGLGLVGTSDIPPLIPLEPYFKSERIEGTWYRIAMVVSGTEQKVLAGDIHISPRQQGNLALQRNIQKGSTCTDINFQLKHAGEKGADTETTIYVVDTDYEQYLILYIVTPADRALYLFGSEEQVPNSIREYFKEDVEYLRFSLTDITFPGRDEKCPLSVKEENAETMIFFLPEAERPSA
ncbi:epididymal secretory protein 4-like [Rhineura floridana]|uniref:epididymal secretory protein 4-like n=1 Tax=Rhineura floridana TaxID=261503 RepID=UPI002AC84F97|nr:epididymal secretory protein 4-like [Rhineura floridana]